MGAASGANDRNGNEIEAAIVIPLIGREQLGIFQSARPTPGRPEIDHQHLARRVGPQSLEAVLGHRLDRPRLGLPFLYLALDSVDLAAPFRAAAEDRRMFDRYRLSGQKRVDRVAG